MYFPIYLCAVCRLLESFCKWVRVAHVDLALSEELEQEKNLSDIEACEVLKDGCML